MAESEEELNNLLMKVKLESEKASLKLNIFFKKMWRCHSAPSLYGKQKGKGWKQWQISISRAPKSLQMVTAAMKLEDTRSLEEKLWQT